MWKLAKPNPDQIQSFLCEQSQLPLSFTSGMAGKFQVDHERVLLGHGAAVYQAACDALRQWRMFPPGWTEVSPPGVPLVVQQPVAVLAKAFGVWWLNACRIISVINETGPDRRFGFVYATLPGHAEMGEELFLVEWDSDDCVWYQIRAVSRPRYWLIWLAYPLARWLQHRFRCDSMRAMQSAVRDFPQDL